jgi:D-tyrosyl-tRNA(Tyr) deacylase
VKLVIQRVQRASVAVAGDVIASIGPGLLVLAGVRNGDSLAEARRLAAKTAELRILAGEQGRFNRSLLDTDNECLVVSQFTLYADVRRGRRPSFNAAAPAEVAEPLVEAFAAELEALGVRVARGRFGAMMQVDLTNDGPVTLVIDSSDLDQPRR